MEQTQTQTAAAKKAPPLTTAQKIAALEEKKQRLIEKSRKEETRKKIILGAAIAALLVDLACTETALANRLAREMGKKVAEKDMILFSAMIDDIGDRVAKKTKAAKAETKSQPHAQTTQAQAKAG